MSRGGRDEGGGVLLLCVAGVLIAVAIAHVHSLTAHAPSVDGRWLAAGAVAVLASTMLLTAVRALLIARALRRRSRIVLLPTDAFDPTPEAVVRFAAGLAGARSVRGLLDRPARAVRMRIDLDDEQQMRFAIELPTSARAALRAALGAYPGVEPREQTAPGELPPAGGRDQPDTGQAERDGGEGDGRVVRRMELVLARGSVDPLRAAGLDPDPLSGFATALASIRTDLQESAVVAVDVLPLTAARRRRLRRRLLRRARRDGQPSPAWDGLLGPRPGRAAPAELIERRSGTRALQDKLGTPEPLFEIQVLIQATSTVPGRAELQARSLLSAFDAFSGENYFRAVGIRIPGLAFLGSDLWWRRGRFDRRLRSGRFAPARRRLVTASEIAGLLKPPTVRCEAPNVLRSGGTIPPPPQGLPTFTGQRDLLPLGQVHSEHGTRTVGVPLEGTFFSYMAGRSRYGKTELAIGQFLHLVRSGHGGFFLDPHDALAKIKPYLTEPGLRERVIVVNLADDLHGQPGWNLFAAHGRRPQRIAEQVDAVIDAFASALGWDERNTRALNLTGQAAQALVELAAHLPADRAPTLFQMPTLLGNEKWRTAVLPYVSPATRQFFQERFPRLSNEAITPVTNLIDRLRVSPAVAALLGSPTSTYDIRTAMDTGRIVLVCPGSGSARDRLVANFFVYDLLHAAKTRASLTPQQRRPFFAFFDEVQTYDGASSGNLAALLEQTAKYGVRGFFFNQNPERLSPDTLNALTTNRSQLLSTAVNAKAAALLAREWGDQVKPSVITGLERYTYLASVTLNRRERPPFLVHGLPVEQLLPDAAHPDQLEQLERELDRDGQRRPVTATLELLEQHDQRIVEHLTADNKQRPAGRLGISADEVRG